VRWALALVAAAALLALGLGVASFIAVHDTPPDEVEACVEDLGGSVILGQEGLAFARQDIERSRLRTVRRYRLDDDRALLLQGRGYRVLVVGVPGGPPLGGADLPVRLYTQTASFAVVATERDPLRGVLDRCARRSSTAAGR
jgi:hypothetical protein